MKKQQKQTSISTLKVIGILAAISGLASGAFYMYHQQVMLYRPNDVSDGFGAAAFLLSVVAWLVFATLYMVKSR